MARKARRSLVLRARREKRKAPRVHRTPRWLWTSERKAGRFPLLPDAVGIGRLVGDAPMEIPQAGVSRRFEEQTGHYVVGIADAVWREMMRGDEGPKAGAHSGCGFEQVGFCVKSGNELRQRRIGGRLSFRGASRVLGHE